MFSRRLVASSVFNASPVRCTSAFTSTSTPPASASTSQPTSQDSIFTAPESPWDHVFADIDAPEPRKRTVKRVDGPLPTAAQRIRARLDDDTVRRTGKSPRPSSGALVQRASTTSRRQRASLTAREMSVFDEMFDLIFNAVSARDASGSDAGMSAPAPPGIGRTSTSAGAPLDDLFRTLRKQTSRVRWTSAIDEELDRKKETMELLDTDHELLQWVMTEVFGETARWDEEARKAVAAGRSAKDGKTKEDARATTTPVGRHSIYPHLIAHAMRTFRTRYSNPTLSLAIFDHAARTSIPSYVFGCTAPVYNELIEAKWEGWGDLEGVCRALEEMRANGVKMDGKTRLLAENVRRELGEARPGAAASGDVHPVAGRVWEKLGEGEVIRLVHRVEQLAIRERSTRKSARGHEEIWKDNKEDDGWRFDGWR